MAEEAQTVLVIDDDPQGREAVCEFLTEAGYVTKGLPHGEGALAYLRETEELPDLVLLDLLMPEKDGWLVLWELRQDPRLRQLSVIVLSSFASEQHALWNAGVAALVDKPFEPEELLAAVRKHSRRPRRLHAM